MLTKINVQLKIGCQAKGKLIEDKRKAFSQIKM